MLKSTFFSLLRLAIAAAVLILPACTPAYDWREVRGTDAPFAAVFPAKPATYSRMVNLNGTQVMMTMTAAEAAGVTFAVGSAQLPDPAAAQGALQAMKTAMIGNIGGTVRHEKQSAIPANGLSSIDLEATGASTAGNSGQSRLLIARFVAKDRRVYQAVVIGTEKAISRDAVDTFFTSFKLD